MSRVCCAHCVVRSMHSRSSMSFPITGHPRATRMAPRQVTPVSSQFNCHVVMLCYRSVDYSLPYVFMHIHAPNLLCAFILYISTPVRDARTSLGALGLPSTGRTHQTEMVPGTKRNHLFISLCGRRTSSTGSSCLLLLQRDNVVVCTIALCVL